MKLSDIFSMNHLLRRSKLLSCRDSHDPEITSVSLYYSPRDAGRLHPGAFVLLGLYEPFPDADQLEEVAALLEKAGAVGMGCRMSAELEARACEGNCRFPVVGLDPGIRINRAFEDLLCRAEGYEVYLTHVEDAFDRDLLWQSGRSHLPLTLLRDYLQYPLRLCWNGNYFIHAGRDDVVLEEADGPLLNAISRMRPDCLCVEVTRPEGRSWAFPVRDAQEVLAFLEVFPPNGMEPAETDAALIAKALPWIALRLASGITKSAYLTQSRTNFFTDIMLGNYGQQEELLNRNAQMLGLRGDCHCLLWGASGESDSLPRLAESMASALGCPFEVVPLKPYLFCLVRISNKQSVFAREQEFFSPCERLVEKTDIPNLHIGVSRCFSSLSHLREAYQEVCFLLRYLPLKDSRPVHYYAPYIIYHMLDVCADSRALYNIYYYTAERVREYDSANDTELFPTLQALVSQDFNINQTASALYLHRNTVYKRIRKTLDLLNMDLNNREHRLSLQLMVRMHALMHDN